MPVRFYVDLNTKDTIDGETGLIVNNTLLKNSDGVYAIDESKIKSNDTEVINSSENIKVKVYGDKVKIKTDEKKIKINGDEMKMKILTQLSK
jgi:vacuolar-type H+-ATPase subunit B/Vma2